MPSAEVHRRVQQLLDRLEKEVLSADRLRELRAVEVLEQIGTEEARQVLTALAKGDSEAPLTREAKASLRRLAERPAAAR